MNISKLLNFLKRNRGFLVIIGVFASFFLLGAESLFANDEPVLSQEDSEKVVKILNGIITGAAALMGMVTSFITMFLYPGWVNGTLFGLQDYLKEMWILVSNIVYFIFAFILIAIAFMNIIGKGEGTWELKQAMPKFIIGVLIVPFSWFFVQFLLSISAVLTVGVLTLPYDSFGDHDLFEKALDNTELAGEEICKDVVISFNGNFDGVEGVQPLTSEENELDENVKCKDKGKITIKELITGRDKNGDPSKNAAGLQNSIFGVISIYSYGILRIHDLDTITGNDLESVETIVDLIFKIVFDVLFIIVYLLLMVALLLALFVRGVRLWIYMMLSPVFGLFYFFGSKEVGDTQKFGIVEFIHLALIPVYVSAALAFGLLFILVASEGIKETNNGSDTLQAGGFSLTILGAHGGGESEKSVIAKLVVEIFGIVILWIAVMFALSRSETTKQVTDPIRSFGSEVGKLAAKAPTYAPIIPTGTGQGLSAEGLRRVGKLPAQAMDGQVAERVKNFGDRTGLTQGAVDPTRTQRLQDMWRDGDVTHSELGEIQTELRAIARERGTGDRAFQDLLKEFNQNVQNSNVMSGKNSDAELFNGSRLTDYGAGLLFAEATQDVTSIGSRAQAREFASENLNPSTPTSGDQSSSGNQPTTGTSTGDVTINVNGNTTQSFSTTQEAGENFAQEQLNGANKFTDRNALNTFLTSLENNGGLNQNQITEILDAFDEERA